MPAYIKDKKIVIYGFGAQGRSHALNLVDSGLDVTICLPEASSSISEVKSLDMPLITSPAEAAKKADIAVFLVPDSVQKNLYNEIGDFLPRSSAIIFAHGLNIHYKLISPRDDLDVILVAPLAHGETVRRNYLKKITTPVLTAVSQNISGAAWEIAKAYAAGIGSSGNKMIKTTFKEETVTDLFTEQSLICGGLWRLIATAFDTLVEAGYSPEMAYYCCLKETQIMSDMFARFGIKGTFDQISDAALFGALSRGPRVIDEHVKTQMKKVLDEIEDGGFIREFEENLKKPGDNKTTTLMKRISEHELEKVHKNILRHSQGEQGQDE